jgi:hypothetical protein
MKTLHLGPEELLVAAKIAVPATRRGETWPGTSTRPRRASARRCRSPGSSTSSRTSTARRPRRPRRPTSAAGAGLTLHDELRVPLTGSHPALRLGLAHRDRRAAGPARRRRRPRGGALAGRAPGRPVHGDRPGRPGQPGGDHRRRDPKGQLGAEVAASSAPAAVPAEGAGRRPRRCRCRPTRTRHTRSRRTRPRRPIRRAPQLHDAHHKPEMLVALTSSTRCAASAPRTCRPRCWRARHIPRWPRSSPRCGRATGRRLRDAVRC